MRKSSNVFRKSNVLSVAAAHLLHDVFSSFFAPLIPLLMEKHNFTYAVAGALSVVQKIPSLLNPLIGIIADRFVIRSIIIVSPLVTVFAMSFLGVVPSVTLLAVLLFVTGLSAAVFHVTAPILVRQVSGNKIGRGMSFFMFGGEIARTVGPLLITAAVSWWGLEGSWRLFPFGSVASLVLFFKLRTICKQHIGKFHKQSRMPLGKTLRSIAPFFGIVTPIMLFRAFSKTALTTFLPAYMVAGGHSMGSAAAALALLELAGAGGALLSGSLSDRMGRKTILLVIMLTSPVLMFGFTCVAGMGQWILLGLMGVTFFASTPVFLAMVQDLKSDRPSFLNGLFMTLSFAASSIVALLVGVFADHVGFVATYRIAAAMSLCAIPFTLFLRDE